MTVTAPTVRWRALASGQRETGATELATLAAVAADFSFMSGAQPAISFRSEGVGAITSWLWDFGDTNTSTARDIIHTYVIPVGDTKTYTVKLTVNAGPNKSKSVTVSNPLPSAGAVVLAAKTLSVVEARTMTVADAVLMTAE